MGKNKNKKNTQSRESPWSPGRQEAFPWGLAGFPGPPSRPWLHLPEGGGLRPSWAGPRSECPLPPGEEGWLGGGHCSPVRAPMGTWSPADAAERAVQGGSCRRAGGEGGLDTPEGPRPGILPEFTRPQTQCLHGLPRSTRGLLFMGVASPAQPRLDGGWR